MALDLKLVYPGQIDTTDLAAYPQGKAKNIVNPGDGTGTPWEKQIVNDLLGFEQELLDRAGISPSGTPDEVNASQYATGVEAIGDERIALSPVRTDILTVRGCFAHAHQGRSGFDDVNNQSHWSSFSTAGAAVDIQKAYNLRGTLSWGFAAGSNLPFQCTVTTVRVFVKQGAAYAAGNRMLMRVSTRDSSTFDSTVIDTVEAAAGTAIQVIEKTGLSIDLVGTDSDFYIPSTPIDMTVSLFAGFEGVAPTDDLAYLCEVRYTLAIL